MAGEEGNNNTATADQQGNSANASSGAVDAAAETQGLEHFTAAGRPKPNFDPSISNTDFGMFTGSGAPNLLPVRFTDDSIINVPIPADDLQDDDDDDDDKDDDDPKRLPPAAEARRSSWISTISKKFGSKEAKKKIVMIRMTRGEYLKYWAKDENGNYIGTEPEGTGKRIWREKRAADERKADERKTSFGDWS